MRITSIVEALVQCGATPEMILCAVRAAEASQQSDIDRRRASDRERQQRRRAHVTSRAVTVTHGIPLSDKERSPKPPKEINSPDTTDAPAQAHSSSVGGRRAMRLPEQFEPDRDFAARLGFGAAEVALELEKFRDYWTAKPGRDAAKLDWLATWRNWMRNAARPRKNHRPQAPPRESAFARHQRECRQAIEREFNGDLRNDDPIDTQSTFDLEPGDYCAR